MRKIQQTQRDGKRQVTTDAVTSKGGGVGRGKTHLLCAIAHELILRHGIRVLFMPAVHLVQQLLVAKRDLKLESFLRKLDGFDVVLVDDIGYIQQSPWISMICLSQRIKECAGGSA